MNQKIKIYFIGGLGSNYYFAKDFFQELEVETIFLNPYKEIIQDKKELQKLIVLGKKIEEEVKNEQTYQEKTTIYCK